MTKLTPQAAGTFAIAPTPFHDDGRIDEKSIDRLTDFYAEVGCDGVTVLGILGEAPKLDAAEAEQVASVSSSAPKPCRSSSAFPRRALPPCARWRKASMDAGAAGVMIAPPPHLRTDDQITGYFKQAQEAIGDRDSLGAAGLSADPDRRVHARRDPQDRDGLAVLRHAQARGLAGPGKDLGASRLPEGRLAEADVDPGRQWRPVPRFRDGARRRRRHDRLRLPGTADRCRRICKRPASATPRTICSTPICR